jgi:hypothetical protein
MIVLFRSCEANLSAGSLGDGTQNVPRWNGKYKLEILRKCYLSIQKGLTSEDSIVIINDRTTPETITWMEENTAATFCVKNIKPLDKIRSSHKYPYYHPVVANGCEDLMEYIIKLAELHPDELIYVCEDDYLHVPVAIEAMKKVFANGFKGFYAPYDYPDRYTVDSNRTCEVHAGGYGHLRTIPSATLTVAALGITWAQYKYEILRAGVFADDSWTWKAFKQSGAVCPIPGHATHLQNNCITPYVDWDKVYKEV